MTKANLTRNTTYFTAALTIQKILAFIYFWLISNNLFPAQLGQYVFALSFTTLFSILIDLGLSPILTREASKNKDKANEYLKNILGLKIPLALITLITAWIIINLTNKPEAVKSLVYLASIIMILDSFSLSFWVIFRSRHNLKYESIATILVQIIIFTLGVIAIKTSGEVIYLIGALLGASLFNFLVSIALIKVKLNFSLRPKLNKDVIKYFLKVVPAFALAGIFVKIYNTSDTVLLSFLADDEAVGFFSVPAKVVFAFQQIIPAAFAAVIFPAFSYYYATSKDKLRETFEKAFSYLTIISIPLTVGLLIFIPEIIRIVWPEYIVVIPTFYVMTLAIPFIFLTFPTGHLLNACDRQKNTTINRGVITALAVITNIILIPRFSFLGAGITFLISNFILLFMDFVWVNKIINIKYNDILKTILKSLGASILMMVILIPARQYFNLIVLIPAGAIIYFGCLYVVKGINFSDFKSLTKKI